MSLDEVDTEDQLSSDEDINEIEKEQIHPFTGEKYTFESITNIPAYREHFNSLEECSAPGHNCWKNFQTYMHTYHHDVDSIPLEKTPVRCLSRKAWGAVPPKEPPERPSRPSLKLVFYYNVGMRPCYTEDECKRAVKELQRRQMEEDGLSDIAFNFVVGGDKTIYEGRGWHAQPDESLKYPTWRHRRIDVAFIAPVLKKSRYPEHELLFIVFDFFRVAIMNYYVHAANNFYEIRDHYKALVPSPKIPMYLCTGEELNDDELST